MSRVARVTAGVGLLFGFAAFFLQSAFAAEPRVALVIGNSEYGPEIGRLLNPANDAKLMANTLKGLGFSVDLVLDADQKVMKRAVKAFGAKLREAGNEATGLFYYAGHGVQVEGINYLLPVGAEIAAEADVEIESVSADDVMTQMQFAGNAVNLVFLDACRNNPLAKANRSGTRGLARLDAPRGSFVAYSTAPGDVAADGDGANSPYALALAEELKKPGISIEEAHRNVRARVLAESGNKQTPWDSSSLTGPVILAEKTAAPASEPAPQSAAKPEIQHQAAVDKEVVFWESIKDSTNPAMYETYLMQYPSGTFALLAAAKIQELNKITVPSTESIVAPAIPALMIEPLDAIYVATQAANVRAGPTTDAAIISRLHSGDIVSVTGKVKDKNWLQVGVSGEDGYVSGALLASTSQTEVDQWRMLEKSRDADGLEAFLAEFPAGPFTSKASALLASLTPPKLTETVPAEPASPASPVATLDSKARPRPPAKEIAYLGHPGWSVDPRNGCWIWSSHPQAIETPAWNGACDAQGRATGRGFVEWTGSNEPFQCEGTWIDGKQSGPGSCTFLHGGRIVGHFVDDKFSGSGSRTWRDGSTYSGAWKNRWPHGVGTAVIDGETFSGNWVQGCLKEGGELRAWFDGEEKCS